VEAVVFTAFGEAETEGSLVAVASGLGDSVAGADDAALAGVGLARVSLLVSPLPHAAAPARTSPSAAVSSTDFPVPRAPPVALSCRAVTSSPWSSVDML
jgi:hypothetical protein